MVLFGREYSWTVVIAGLLLTLCVGMVIILLHISEVPAAFVEIVSSAFGMRAAAGGALVSMTGTWNIGLEGVAVTTEAFSRGVPFAPGISRFLLMLCLIFFAFTTILGWDYYSERCLEYLSGGRMGVVKVFRWLYILAVFIGPFMTVSAVWTIADICNALMAFPNLIALLALNGVVVAETRKYLEKIKRK